MLHQKPTKVKVAIVGAGASGLQCAYNLVHASGGNRKVLPEDIIILEARDRIGGRIWTTNETRRTIGKGNNEVTFPLDHGAAWVHGTGYDWPSSSIDSTRTSGTGKNNENGFEDQEENPMIEILRKTTPDGQDVCVTHLKPVFEKGNPWMRPRHALYSAGEIAFYVNGQCLDKDSPLVSQSLQRHFELLQKVSNIGTELYDRGQGIQTIHQSLQQTIDTIRKNEKQEDGNDHDDRNNDRNTSSSVGKQNKNDDFTNGVVEALIPFYRHLVECWYGSDSSNLQLAEFMSENDYTCVGDGEYTGEGDFYGPHCTLRNGMKTLLGPLLEHGIAERIFLDQQVTKVRNHENTIVLETASGMVVEASCCVVTISVGCLQRNATAAEQSMFEPALPQRKMDAIQCFKIGVYKKVFLTFDRIFWSRHEAFLGLVRSNTTTDDNGKHGHNSNNNRGLGNYLLFDNLWARDDIPCIEAVLFGTSGEWAIQKTDETIRDAVLDFMQEAMGLQQEQDANIQDWCTDCHVTRWEEDCYSYGAYTSYPLGTESKDSDALRQPEWDGGLVFAGEATIPEYEGSVHAALLSGRNAADDVQQVLATLASENHDEQVSKSGKL